MEKDFTNKLILGDNLAVLQSISDKSVDLIYLDPPFFSNRTYEVIWGDVSIEQPIKTIKGIELIVGTKEHNRQISFFRIRIKYIIGSSKFIRIVKVACRLRANNFVGRFLKISVALLNFSIKSIRDIAKTNFI